MAEERRLVAAMRRGDTAARDTLLASVGPLILQVARRFSESPHEVDDLVQEGHIRVLAALDSFDPYRARLTTFCYRALLWAALRERRLRSRRGPTMDADEAELIESPEPPVDAAVDQQIRAETLHQLIACLPLRMGEIVRGRMAGRTLADLGEQFGVSKERVRQIEGKAHDFLRRAMGGIS